MRPAKRRLHPHLLIGEDPRRAWWGLRTFYQFASNFCFRNNWRTPHNYSQEELMREAYLQFLETCRRYYWVVEHKHLMALFKQRLHSWMTELSYRGSLDKLCLPDGSQADDESRGCVSVQNCGADAHQEMELYVVLQKLPAELKEVVQCLLSDSRELLQVRRKKQHPFDTPIRETNNERMCRLVGKDPTKVNLSQALRDFFSLHLGREL